MESLPGLDRGGEALERGDPEADARARPPDLGARLPVATGVVGVVGVRDSLRRFGAGFASLPVGVSGSDSSVTDS